MSDINWKDLAAPIPANEVKTKPGRGGKQQSFITARTVMNRLDTVLGPGNWRDEYTTVNGGVLCTIFIKVDGEWIGKSDAGDAGDIEPVKSAHSDAFKRAAVKWGIGRELYRDGTAQYEDDDEDEQRKHNERRIPTGKPATTQPGESELDKFIPRGTPEEPPAQPGEEPPTENPVGKVIQGEGSTNYDPSQDTTPFTSVAMDRLRNHLKAIGRTKVHSHGTNTILTALLKAKKITAEERGSEKDKKPVQWTAIYSKKLTVQQVWAAVEAYDESKEQQPAA